MLSSSDIPGRCDTPNAAATTCAIVSPSAATASSHSHAPSRNRGSTSAATCTARRVLPTPPVPGQRHQAPLVERLRDPRQLLVAAHERRQLRAAGSPGTHPATATAGTPPTGPAHAPGTPAPARPGPADDAHRGRRTRRPASRTNSLVADDTTICPPCATRHQPRRAVHRAAVVVPVAKLGLAGSAHPSAPATRPSPPTTRPPTRAARRPPRRPHPTRSRTRRGTRHPSSSRHARRAPRSRSRTISS